MINQHYLHRYDKFIETMKKVKKRKGYTEVHHIQPRCLHGTDDSYNLIELSIREHFLAHWLLWKAYPDYLPICSAFLQMNNKNPNTSKGFQGRISSRVYDRLKTEAYNMISERMKGRVFVKDSKGSKIEMSSDEFKNSDLKFHTTGKVWVLNLENNEWIYILSSEYHENKERYSTRLSSRNPNEISYNFYDTKNSGRILKIRKSDVRRINKKFGYKRLKQIMDSKISVVSETGEKLSISVYEYDPSIHCHINHGTFAVYDSLLEKTVRIKKDDYNIRKERYKTSTKDKVLAKDLNTGERKLITREEFVTGYVGHTKGLTSVKDRNTGEFVQITQEEFIRERHKYSGPCEGKVNARNKLTGEMKQISKDEYDQNTDKWAGASYGLFKIKNLLTSEVKTVTIWDDLKKYNISEWESLSKKYKLN